jgi:hypothetical protein
MSRNDRSSLSITPRKLNQIVRSYLYRKKLADTLESIQLELLAVIKESPNKVVFAGGYAISADPDTGEINLKPLPKTDPRQLLMSFANQERSSQPATTVSPQQL